MRFIGYRGIDLGDSQMLRRNQLTLTALWGE
jgi:hypothetical protein